MHLRSRGQPRSPHKLDPLLLKLRAPQHDRYRQAARKMGLATGTWAKRVLDLAAGYTPPEKKSSPAA